MLHQLLTDFWERAALLLLIFAMGFIAEQLIPAERRVDIPGALLNCMVGFFLMAGEAIAAMIVASAFVKLPGSGLSSFMAIPDRGSILKSAGLAFSWLAMRDFFYYWLHRLQHASKWLWAEHAVHHSDESLNITSSIRHHWLDAPLTVIFVVAPLSYLFRPPLLTVPIIALTIGMVGVFNHLNVRVGLGHLAWLIATPQNHRIHHSRLPEHIDKNFAQFFPLWDVLFGTYYRAKRGEYPPTGLASGERVTTLKESMLLPFVTWRKMLSRN